MRSLSLVAFGLALSATAFSQILTSTGFESSEGFSNGSIVGQNSWLQFGNGGASAGQISGTDPQGGLQALTLTANGVNSNSYWFQTLNSDFAGKVCRVTWDQKVNAGPSSLEADRSQSGVAIYDPSGQMLTGLMIDNFDGAHLFWNGTTNVWTPLAATGGRYAYNRYSLTVNATNGKSTFDVNGVRQPENSLRSGTSTVIGDVSVGLRFAGLDTIQIDNFSVEKYSPGLIRGTVIPQQYIGAVMRPIVVEVRSPGTQNVVFSTTTSPSADGTFSISTGLNGTFDVAVKGKTHLRRVIPNVVIADEGVFGLTWSLTNGDVSNDNIVDIADYVYLATNFGRLSTDSGWTTPDGAGIAPQDSDLNGDLIVDIADYTILAFNFSAEGDL